MGIFWNIPRSFCVERGLFCSSSFSIHLCGKMVLLLLSSSIPPGYQGTPPPAHYPHVGWVQLWLHFGFKKRLNFSINLGKLSIFYRVFFFFFQTKVKPRFNTAIIAADLRKLMQLSSINAALFLVLQIQLIILIDCLDLPWWIPSTLPNGSSSW